MASSTRGSFSTTPHGPTRRAPVFPRTSAGGSVTVAVVEVASNVSPGKSLRDDIRDGLTDGDSSAYCLVKNKVLLLMDL